MDEDEEEYYFDELSSQGSLDEVVGEYESETESGNPATSIPTDHRSVTDNYPFSVFSVSVFRFVMFSIGGFLLGCLYEEIELMYSNCRNRESYCFKTFYPFMREVVAVKMVIVW